ncbi:MAG: hypothetical protein K6E96_06795 [Bacteroidales bacterium]|nr:hypothetical protein [Bacteroidales bacterium]
MKKTTLLLALASVAVLFASCASSSKPTKVRYAYNEYTIKTMEVDGSGIVTPIAADIKVEATHYVWSETFDNELEEKDVNNPKNSTAIQSMKDYTMAKALKQSNSDLLVAPLYSVSTSADLRKITVTVTGYPATYYNFRTATEADFNLLRKMADSHNKPACKEKADEPAIKLPFGK